MRKRISDAEWRVMEALWQDAPQTSRELIDRVVADQRWSPKTLRTLLARLVKKGAVVIEEDSSPYRYRPVVTRNECVRAATESFLRQVFAGDPAALLLHFVRSDALTKEQLHELRAILSEEDS